MGMEFLDGVNYYGTLLAFMMVLATDNEKRIHPEYVSVLPED